HEDATATYEPVRLQRQQAPAPASAYLSIDGRLLWERTVTLTKGASKSIEYTLVPLVAEGWRDGEPVPYVVRVDNGNRYLAERARRAREAILARTDGGVAGPAAQMGLREAMATTQLKLLAALPPERQQAAERIAARFHLDPVGWFRETQNAERLPALAQAVWNSRRLDVRYHSWKGVVDRELEPLGLILKAGVWYLAASVAGSEARGYRVENILDMTVRDEAFDRPGGFNLEAFWKAFSSRFETDIYTGEATLRVTQEGLRRLSHLGAATAAAIQGKTAGGGWIEVTVPIESVAHASIDFLRLGDEAEVLSPAELRDGLAATFRKLVQVYADA
ncbi:MAG: WYL domain-containing protein, partial [Caulobacter sp.]